MRNERCETGKPFVVDAACGDGTERSEREYTRNGLGFLSEYLGKDGVNVF
jgi:hypothetical protein